MVDLTYIVAPLILISVVLGAVWLDRWSVPMIVVALGAGIIFGSDVLNLWHFEDAILTNRVANLALVFILFHGGFGTRREDVRAVALPACGLATWGVVLTALFTCLTLWLALGWELRKSCLLAAIISSTDAAAIFSILRRHALPRRIACLVEVESAANDPMAVLLTVVAVRAFGGEGCTAGGFPLESLLRRGVVEPLLGTAADSGAYRAVAAVAALLWKFVTGPLVGLLAARGALWLFNRLNPRERGHYYVLFIAVVMLTYGLAESVGASGMLAVFVAGYVMGNRPFVHKQGVANFSGALATVANTCMFVLMGLLVFPSQWRHLWVQGLTLFLVLSFISRPLAVLTGTLGMRLPPRTKIFVAWTGLRGSVPVVLATYPAAAGLPEGLSRDIFNLVFFAVLLSVLVQGSTLGLLARRLGFPVSPRPEPLYSLELITMARSEMDLLVVELPGPPGIEGPAIQELRLPPSAVITLITRGPEVVSPRGQTRLRSGDTVTVLAHVADHQAVRKALTDPFRDLPGNAASPAAGCC
jgi:cell volume regulation protein A